MKKKLIAKSQSGNTHLRGNILTKFFRMVRVTLLFFFLGVIQLMAVDSYSQVTRLSLKASNESLENVLNKIEEQTEFFFFYNKDLINVERKVKVSARNETIKEILDDLFEDTEIAYEVKDRQIVLKNKMLEEIAYPQQKEVTGSVRDANGEWLPGVTIVIKGKTVGTTTDVDGKFSIDVNPSDVLVFSFVGFKTKEVAVNNQESFNITMETNVHQLEEYVVTALGISRESKALPYNTQTIPSEELVAVKDANNVINSLQGKVANALITQSSAGVGGEASIILRGNSSISKSNSALVVVDGVPNSRSANINPDDIESMTILNGSAAAALYGSEAGNGVVVITTKKGKKEEVSVSLNSSLTLDRAFSLPQFQNVYGQGSNGTLNPTSGDNWGAEMTGQEYTNYLGESRNYSAEPDNVKEFFSTGIHATNAISISGGGEKATGYLSYTNNSVEGIVPNNKIKSHNFNLRLTNQISKKLSTDAKITYYTANVGGILRAGEGNTAALDAYQIPRNVSISDVKRFETVDETGILTPEEYPSPIFWRYQNPYWVTEYDRLSEERNQIFGFINIKYDITDWLSVKGRANIDRSNVLAEQRTSVGTVGMEIQPGGWYRINKSTYTTEWYDFSFDGSNKINESLSVDYHLGGIYQDKKYSENSVDANGLYILNKFSTNFASNPVPSQSSSRIKTQSLYALVNLAYKNALYLDASIRSDWDSRLPSPYSYQYYSIGGSSILTEFIKLPEFISFMKLTASYAEVGNGGQFGLLENTFNYSSGTANGYISRSSTYSIPNLKPEIVQSREIGLETRFFNNRLSTEVTYYRSNAKNQLLTIGMPYASGYNSQYINAGNIENHGFEIVVSGEAVNTGNFKWDVAFNAGFNRNKVIELSEGLDVVYLGDFADWGGRPQISVGGSYGDIVVTKWARNDNGDLLVTNDGLPVTSGAAGQQPTYIGNFNPDAILGLTNTFEYKDFSLKVLVDGRVGGVAVSGTEVNLSHSGITESTLAHREGGWNLGGVNIDGDPVNTEINAQQFWQTVSGKRYGTGEFFTYDATNFRVRELTLGYEVPVPESFFIKSAKVSIVARNLMWIYRGKSILKIPGLEDRTMWFDPDVTLGHLNTFKGIEYGMPSTRSIGFNLSLNF